MAGKKKTYSFGAMLSRMKYIDRWALMRNSTKENISEHSLEVAMIAHLLAVIGRVRFGKELDADKAALIGIYHDSTEIITGDMPTPIKYYNDEMRDTFKEIEDISNLREINNAQLRRVIDRIEVDSGGNVEVFLKLFRELGLDETVPICNDRT